MPGDDPEECLMYLRSYLSKGLQRILLFEEPTDGLIYGFVKASRVMRTNAFGKFFRERGDEGVRRLSPDINLFRCRWLRR